MEVDERRASTRDFHKLGSLARAAHRRHTSAQEVAIWLPSPSATSTACTNSVINGVLASPFNKSGRSCGRYQPAAFPSFGYRAGGASVIAATRGMFRETQCTSSNNNEKSSLF